MSRDASVGRFAILGDTMEVDQHFIAWRCDEMRLSSEYLYHWLQFEKPEFERVATGSTIKTIGLVPPRDVQARVVQVIAAAMTELALLRNQLTTFQRQKRGLMQKLLTCQWRLGPFRELPA